MGFAAVIQGVVGVVVSRAQKVPWVAAGVERVIVSLKMAEVAKVLQLVLLCWCKRKKFH